jgi:outer membrane protein OmpA-like peptidoglycan-associated protein
VILFALSTITPIKWEAFIETQNMKLGYTGTSRTESQNNKTATSISTTSELSRRTAALDGGHPTRGPSGAFDIRRTIRPDGDLIKGGLIRFQPGSAVLNTQAKEDLKVMLPILSTSSNKIMVKGYVAPTEIEGGIYSQDVYLAYDRAIHVKEYLISLGLKEEFFQISVADSTTLPNRAILPRETDPKLAGASAAVFLADVAGQQPCRFEQDGRDEDQKPRRKRKRFLMEVVNDDTQQKYNQCKFGNYHESV